MSMFFKPNGERETHSTRYADHQGGADTGPGKRINREEHAARGIYSQVASSTNKQMSNHERALAEGANRLEKMCTTGARIIGGDAYRSKVVYKFNGDHGFGHGRSGSVEVPNNKTVIIHK